jgi:PAS domain S-box-containing protein
MPVAWFFKRLNSSTLMVQTAIKPDFSFLHHSEVGRHIKTIRWQQHLLGAIRYWDPVLLHTLNVILESGFPMVLYWGDNNICFYNDAFKPSFGAPKNQLGGIGKPLAEVFPEVFQGIDTLIADIKKTGKSVFYEDVPTKLFRDGELVDTTWTYSYSPVRNLEGDILGVVSVCIETTEKVTHYQNITASETRFRKTFQQAPIGIIIIKGKDRIIEFANDLYLQFVGRDSSCIGKNVWEVLPEVKEQGFDKIMDDVFQTGRPYRSAEHEVKLKRNGVLQSGYYTFSYEPVFGDDGTVETMTAIVVDVTEQVIARQKVEVAEKRLSQAVEVAQIGTYDFDLITEQVIASERLYEIFGYVYEAAHCKLVDTIHPDDRKLREAAHRKAYATGHLSYEARVIWPNKKVRWIKVNGNVFYDNDRTPIRIIGSVLDITDDKETRAQLTETAERLGLALKAGKLGSFELEVGSGKIICTEQCKANFGLEPDTQFSVTRLFSMIVDEDKERVKNALTNSVTNAVPYDAEYRVTWPDNSIHTIHAWGLPVTDKTGKVVRTIGVTVEKQ